MIALSPTDSLTGQDARSGHKKPGLSLVFVVSKYPKFRAEVVKSLQANFAVEYFSSLQAVLPRMKQSRVPRLIVVDYDLVSHGARDFTIAKLESEAWCDVPMLVTGKVDEKVYNETIHQVCRTGYLRRPFLQSNLLDAATRLVDGPIEDQWKTLPARQRDALQGTLGTMRAATMRIKTRKPLNMAETRENCLPLMEEVLEGNAKTLIDNLKGHHNYTYVHSIKTSSMLSILGQAIGVKGDELLTITSGGFLMDIGKLATPQKILNSPDKLSKDDFKELKKHVLYSHDILKRVENVGEGVRTIAEQHHERIDGSGYPRGLKGKQLNELARFAAIVDVFCALTDERPYKLAHARDEAFQVLDEMKDKLDPFLLTLFKQIASAVYDNKSKASSTRH